MLVSDSLSKGMFVPYTLLNDHIELIHLGNNQLYEPFFSITTNKIKTEDNVRRIRINELKKWCNFIKPSAFIFHVGRCGSTLLSNILSIDSSFRIVKEASIINKLLLSNKIELFSDVVQAFGNGLSDEQNLIIKCSSWNAIMVEQIISIFPNTPMFFVWREPEAVVESCMREPPGWYNWYHNNHELVKIFGKNIDSPISFFANAWKSCVINILNASKKINIISYNDLNSKNLKQLVSSIYMQLNLKAPNSDLVKDMANELGFYSKSPNREKYSSKRENDIKLNQNQKDQVASITDSARLALLG